MRRVLFRWRGDDSGSVMILAAAAIAVFVGLLAFVVDLSNAYSSKGRLQNAADAAALAAAQHLPGSPEAAREAALELARLNVNAGDGVVVGEADIELGQWSSETGAFAAGREPFDAVRVTARRSADGGNPLKAYFGGLFGAGHLELASDAIAVRSAPPCVIALDPAASGAFRTTGTADVEARDCGIQVNSTAGDALRGDGASSITASSVCVAGGYRGGDIDPLPQPGCRMYPDPLSALPEPAMPDSECYLENVTIRGNRDIPAGAKLCGRIQIAAKAHVRFYPGTIYFENAELHLSGQASIEGDGVTLFFDRHSTFHLASQGMVRLTAPQTGNYRGIAIFQSRQGGLKRGKITGGRELMIGGTIYAPRLDLEMAGHSAMHGEISLGQVIANTFSFAGTAQAVFARGAGTPPALRTSAVLVE